MVIPDWARAVGGDAVCGPESERAADPQRVPDWMPSKLLPEIGLFLDAPDVPIDRDCGEPG